MHTRKILSIVALSLLGLCLLCALAKNAMKGDKAKKACDRACSMSVFAALTLLAVSQLMGENENFSDTDKCCCDTTDKTCGQKCEGNSDCPMGAYCQEKKCKDLEGNIRCGQACP